MVVRRHRLSHLSALRIDPTLLTLRFPAGCTTGLCDATCCREGVWVDLGERDRILAQAEAIQRVMDPEQERDPARWFDDEERLDSDFPSGRAFGTSVRDAGCVFLDRHRRCVLQTAALGLKPFFCAAFPITLDHGTLTFDTPSAGERPQCCTASPRGTRTIFDVWPGELEHVLGPDGVAELRRHAQRDRR
jgi:Fe-S-cluster containining protein